MDINMEVNDILIPESPRRPAIGGEKCRAAATEKQLQETAKKFEAIFVHEILKQAKQASDSVKCQDEDEEDQPDSGSENIEDMSCSFMADAVAKRGGLGLWKQIYQQLLSQQTQGRPERLDGKI